MNRKSLIVIMILLLTLLTLTACGKTEEAAKASDDPSASPLSETTETGISGIIQLSSDQTDGTGNGATIIAKSNNAVTDSEKQKILTNLNSEIDNLINSINALDDVQASDLTLE